MQWFQSSPLESLALPYCRGFSLTLSVSIEFLAWSARVTSVKFQKCYLVTTQSKHLQTKTKFAWKFANAHSALALQLLAFWSWQRPTKANLGFNCGIGGTGRSRSLMRRMKRRGGKRKKTETKMTPKLRRELAISQSETQGQGQQRHPDNMCSNAATCYQK